MGANNQMIIILKITSSIMKIFASIILIERVGTLWGFGEFKIIGGLFAVSALLDMIEAIMGKRK